MKLTWEEGVKTKIKIIFLLQMTALRRYRLDLHIARLLHVIFIRPLSEKSVVDFIFLCFEYSQRICPCHG